MSAGVKVIILGKSMMMAWIVRSVSQDFERNNIEFKIKIEKKKEV